MSARRRRSPRPRPGSSTKVRDPAEPRPRLYTIPPSAPFLSTLASAVLNGDLPVPGGAKPDKLTLPQAIIYLPTRRAVRAFRDAFLEASVGQAALLPSIRRARRSRRGRRDHFRRQRQCRGQALPAPAAPAVSAPLERRLALMRLVLAWSKTLHESGKASQTRPCRRSRHRRRPLISRRTSATSWTSSKVRRSTSPRSKGLAPEEHADTGKNGRFLKIVTDYWPAHLARRAHLSYRAAECSHGVRGGRASFRSRRRGQ